MQLYTQLKLVKRITKTNNSKSTNDHNAVIKGRWAAGESRRTCQLLVGAVVVVSFKILYNIYRQTNVFTMFVFVDISSILFRASWQSICIITINITFIITMPLFNATLNLYSYCVRIGLWAPKAGLHTSTDNTDANVHVSTCICVKYFKLFNWQSLKATLISLSNQM